MSICLNRFLKKRSLIRRKSLREKIKVAHHRLFQGFAHYRSNVVYLI
jgi:hypothetical protein